MTRKEAVTRKLKVGWPWVVSSPDSTPFKIGLQGGSLFYQANIFVPQLWNFVACVGLRIRPHVNCEYQIASESALLLLLFRFLKLFLDYI